MQLGWEYWMLSFAIPLSVTALAIVARLVVFAFLSWRAADWWNRVLENRHDDNLERFRAEQRKLDERQDALFQHARTDEPDIVMYIASELTRMRQRLDVMRIEQQAQFDADAARARFSDFQIVWLWFRHRRNLAGRLDGGTTRPLMDPEEMSESLHPPDEFGPPKPPAGDVGAGEHWQRGGGAKAAHPPSMPVPPQVVTLPPIVVITDQLERLAGLSQRGFLTAEEYAKLKATLLDF